MFPHIRESAEPAIPGRIGVVGPCAAGKSTLVRGLRALGFDAQHCAQEHSHVPDMWERLTRPEALVYLDASLETIRRRRHKSFRQSFLDAEHERLSYARLRCAIYVDTDPLTREQVLGQVVNGLKELGLALTFNKLS